MPLVIPSSCANFIVTVTNVAGGISARSSMAFGVRLLGALDQADVGRIANVIRDGWTPNWDNGWTIGPTHVLENDSGVMKVWDDSGTEAGTHGATTYGSPAQAVVITKNTALAGRRHRGRVYMPGPEELNIDEAGILNGTYLNNLQTQVNVFFTALTADASVDYVALFHEASTPNANDDDEVTSMLVRNVIGNMRPRQRR